MWSSCPCVSTIARTRRPALREVFEIGHHGVDARHLRGGEAHARVHEEALRLPFENERVEAELAEPAQADQAQPAGINRQALISGGNSLDTADGVSSPPETPRRSPPLRGAELTGWLPSRAVRRRDGAPAGIPRACTFHCPKPSAIGRRRLPVLRTPPRIASPLDGDPRY